MRRPARPLLLALVCLVAPCFGSAHSREPGTDRHEGLAQDRPLLQQQNAPPQESFAKGWSQSQLDRVTSDVRERLETLRGLSFKRDVRVLQVDPAIFELLTQRAAALEARRAASLAHPTVARLLGMAPREVDLEAQQQAAFTAGEVALYDHGELACYVSENADFDDVPRALVAELAQALDAQHFSLPSLPGTNADAEFARRAVVEGSGLELMSRWLRYAEDEVSVDPEFVFWHTFESIPLETLASLSPVVWRPIVAAYCQGQAFLRGQGRPTVLGSPAPQGDIDVALANPPRSAEQVLHPAKYWNPDRVDEPKALAWSTASLAEAWQVRHENTLGELGCALLTTPFDERARPESSRLGLIGLTFTNRAAAGWGGDRYLLLERASGSLVCAASVWDTPRDAQEFHAALMALAPEIRAAQVRVTGLDVAQCGFQVERIGADRVLVCAWTGLDEDDVSAALGALEFSVQ